MPICPFSSFQRWHPRRPASPPPIERSGAILAAEIDWIGQGLIKPCPDLCSPVSDTAHLVEKLRLPIVACCAVIVVLGSILRQTREFRPNDRPCDWPPPPHR